MTRFALALGALAALTAPFWIHSPYHLHVLIMAGVFAVLAMSLNLLLGYTGQLSLGHVAFFGIGAYTSSLVSLGFSVHLLPSWEVTLDPKPVWLAMLCGTVLAGLCGWVIGRISFKVRLSTTSPTSGWGLPGCSRSPSSGSRPTTIWCSRSRSSPTSSSAGSSPRAPAGP
jgi:ABC-type branched-subunit amino acid transport system permease subunit